MLSLTIPVIEQDKPRKVDVTTASKGTPSMPAGPTLAGTAQAAPAAPASKSDKFTI